jgi:electron transport complex protein RnfG
METEGIGSHVREKAFMEQFVGKTPPLSLGEDIDAVSGATLSSEAAVRAVNDAAAFLAQE